MKNRLFILTEHSPFMMGFVFITRDNRAVIIDGGRDEDLPYLLELVGEREIAAWFLTHPHLDHVTAFLAAVRDEAILPRIKAIYHHFPSRAFVEKCWEEDFIVQDRYEELAPLFADRVTEAYPGLCVDIDGLSFDVLYIGGERHLQPKPNLAVNESSMVIKVTSPGMRSVLFLGDLGPEGGRELLAECEWKLPSDIVQMSHHGHSGVTEEVYRTIAPKACLWCAPEWLWNEEDIEFEPELWGTLHQRHWMDKLGVSEHYVSMNGTQEIRLYRE